MQLIEHYHRNEKAYIYIIGGILLLMVSCTSRKSPDNANISDADSIAVMDSLRPDTLHHPSPDELDGHMPPPPPDSAHDKHLPPPPPDSDRVDGHCHRSELYGKFIVDVTVLNIVSQFLTDGLLFFVSRHCYCSPCIFLCHI